MNRNLVLRLAVSGALAGLAGGVYAQDTPKPEDEKPQIQQLISQRDMALPWLIADGDEDKKPGQPAPELIADGDDTPKQPAPELIAEGDDTPKQPAPELIAEGHDEKSDAPKPELIG